MVEIGYALSSEEHRPGELLRYARMAEEAGFGFALISDHYHPWTKRQGQSPFVWSVIGAIARSTERLRLGTGVTCPILRIHPAIVAQAAATCALLMPGRFFLGVGTGENLNEHVVGAGWPTIRVRLEMLEEALLVIRRLWKGRKTSHYGSYFTVEEARLFSLPDEPIPLVVAASGPRSAALAGRVGDGVISTRPDEALLESFRGAGGEGRPCYGQVAVCWAESEAEARRIAREWWPNVAVPSRLRNDLATPDHFEEAAALVGEDDVAAEVVCGPDPERHIEAIRKYASAGYDRVYVHQIGPDQEGFFGFYREEILPRLGAESR
jgi:coenzyme F420-dependent glucose-6-phosphate dehydrogenase